MRRPRFRWSPALAAALGAVAAMPAGAAGPTAHLRAALDAVPVAMPESRDPFYLVFVDRAAAAEAGVDAPILAGRLPPLAALAQAAPDAWGAAAGIDVEATSWFLGLGSPPEAVTVWGGLSPATVAAFRDRLPTLGFAPLPGVADGFSNGPPMGISLADRAPGDPWRGPLGANHAVALVGDAIVQALDPELLVVAVASRRAPGDIAEAFGPVLAGLDAAAGDGAIVQVAAFEPSVMPPADPARSLATVPLADLPAAIERLESEPAPPGIPPFEGGLMADIRGPDGSRLVLALLYPDCATAEAAGAASVDLWAAPRTIRTAPPDGRAVATTLEDGSGCAAIVTVDGEAGAARPPFDRAVSDILTGDFPPLRIGAP